MLTSRRKYSLLVAISGLAGCGTRERNVVAVASHDSAGVEVVQIPPTTAVPVWSIDSIAETLVGNRLDDLSHQLFRVRAAKLLSDGRIVVASQGTSDIRIFDAKGNHLRSFGRAGKGPGEFLSLTGVIVAGDTLYTYDWQQRRVTVFAVTGDVLQTIDLPLTRAGSVDRLSDGAFVSTSFIGGIPRRPAGIHRDTAAIELIQPAGIKDTVAGAIAFEWYSGGGDGVRIVLPFGRRTYVSAAGGRVDVVESDQMEVRRYLSNGSLDQIVRIDRDQLKMTGEDWDQARDFYLGSIPERDRPTALRGWESIPRPEVLPQSQGVKAAPNGDTWVQEFATTSPWRTWWVIQKDGQLVARVHVPRGSGLLDVSRERVVTITNTDQGQVIAVRRVLR